MIEELTSYLLNPRDKNQKILDVLNNREMEGEWYAQGQLKALRYYLSDDVKIISSVTDGSYQGTVYAILNVNNKFFLWRDSFGSCSGCDAIDGLNEETGYDYIVDTMTSVKEFNKLSDIWGYLKKPEDYMYKGDDFDLGTELMKNIQKW